MMYISSTAVWSLGPVRAIHELAGHQDLITPQRSMDLTQAALAAAIRLLKSRGVPL